MSARVDPGEHRDPFSSTKVSPSRINKYTTCGEQFKRYYIDQEPAKRTGSSALFGRVLHLAMEKWTPDRSQDLLTFVREAWMEETDGTVVRDFLTEYQAISVEAIKQEHAIREAWKAKGKESKAPRMTKDWKDSSVGKKIAKLMPKWSAKLTAGSPWQFDDYDPLPKLYDESLVLSRRIQARLGHLPPTLHTEFSAEVEWQGFQFQQYIDAIEPLLDGNGEMKAIGILDYKTYKKNPAPQLEGDADDGDGAELKDYRQLVMYDVGVKTMVDDGRLALPEGLPIYVGIDYLRTQERRWWKMEQADHDWLKGQLVMYHNGVSNGVFLPANKGSNPNFCDYGETCCLRRAGAGQATRVVVE